MPSDRADAGHGQAVADQPARYVPRTAAQAGHGHTVPGLLEEAAEQGPVEGLVRELVAETFRDPPATAS